jgi:hypothetical protein
MGSPGRTLNDHLKSEPEPPDLRPSSNVDFPVALAKQFPMEHREFIILRIRDLLAYVLSVFLLSPLKPVQRD